MWGFIQEKPQKQDFSHYLGLYSRVGLQSSGYGMYVTDSFHFCFKMYFTASLNDDFEIKNELKKLHTEPFSYMPRHYKNAKKQIFSWEKLAGNSKCLML